MCILLENAHNSAHVLQKKFKCCRPLKESSLKVAMTRAELHKIQHKSIQVVAEGRAGKLFNKKCSGSSELQCNVCLRKIKTICRHPLNNFYQDELDPAEHTKERW